MAFDEGEGGARSFKFYEQSYERSYDCSDGGGRFSGPDRGVPNIQVLPGMGLRAGGHFCGQDFAPILAKRCTHE
jgi:hypothetical protein